MDVLAAFGLALNLLLFSHSILRKDVETASMNIIGILFGLLGVALCVS